MVYSVIIPTYNRPERLQSCLRALSRQDFPGSRFEVIVVDDGSAKPLDDVTSEFSGALRLMLIRQENAGPAAARNTGANHATGDMLAFTDDDCAPAPGWLSNMAAISDKFPEYAVGGRTVNALPDNPYACTHHLFTDYLHAHYNRNPAQATFFTSNNLACPSEGYRAINGFDTSYPMAAGEDRDFCDRWLHEGYRMIYAPDALVYHAHPFTWRTFWRQHANYGRGAYRFHTHRTERKPDKPSLEAGSFYTRLVLAPYLQMDAPVTRYWKPILIGLLMVTQAANLLGYIKEMIKHSREPSHESI